MRQSWSQQSVYYPSVTDVVLRLMALMLAAFVLQVVATIIFPGEVVFDSFRALTLNFRDFSLLQIFTHPLFAAPQLVSALIEILLQCLVLYFFASELERTWGRHNFLRFYIICLAGGAILGTALFFFPEGYNYSGVLHGMDAAIGGVLVAYAILWPDRQVLLFFIIPVRMKWLVFFIFVMLILSFIDAATVLMSLVLYSGGGVAAALFLYYYARKGRQYSVLSDSPMAGDGGSGQKKKPRPSLRERLNQYLRKRRLKKQQDLINRRIEMKDEVDRLLEKISKDGMDSLSKKERAFLDKASKEF